jgi:hypothetical protein
MAVGALALTLVVGGHGREADAAETREVDCAALAGQILDIANRAYVADAAGDRVAVGNLKRMLERLVNIESANC